MRTLQIGGVDRAAVLAECGSDHTVINERCNVVEEIVLCDHVGSLEQTAREHELPMQRDALALQQ